MSSKASTKGLSDKDLDVSKASRRVWLVKVPKYVDDAWTSADDDNLLARMKIFRRMGAKPTVTFNLIDANEEKGKKKEDNMSGKKPPSEHKLVVSAVHSQTLAVFSHTTLETSSTPNSSKEVSAKEESKSDEPPSKRIVRERLTLEGKVVQRAECRPVSNATYMDLKVEAIKKSIEPRRRTQQLQGVVNAYKPVSNHAANLAWEAKKKAEGKKSRDNKERVLEKLFSLFEKHQYYNLKDLVKETRQPVTYLKEILNEVAIYNLKNPHRNMWELKPEYRHYKQDNANEGSSTQDDKTKDDDDSSSDGDLEEA